MKKLTAITVLIVTICFNAFAQMDESLQPRSFTQGLLLKETQPKLLPAFDEKQAAQLDLNDSKNGNLPLFSRNVANYLTVSQPGHFETIRTATGTVYYRTVTSANALGLVLLFNKLYLPEGAMLHVYRPDRKQVLGAYTHTNTPAGAVPFNAGMIAGPSCVIEYYEPAAQTGKGILEITETGHAYRWLKTIEDVTGVEASGACEVNVACSEANNWQEQKRATARILVVAGNGQGFCTGTLVNNVRQDCTPYFLSAQHCSEGTTSAQYAQWVFYFNYEAATCNGTTGPQNKTITGCTKVADSNDNGGDTGSDFLLLLLNATPPSTYSVHYAGWSNLNTASPSGVCIHHPDGDIKKISTYTQTITSTEWGNTVQNTHWNVKWAATANGHGVTEPGSSGSGLFSNQGLLIGTLTGGNSYCSSPNVPDQFGKFSYHWIANGTADNRRLKPWLDPDNTGTTAILGTDAPCGSTVQNDAGIQTINQPKGTLCSNSVTPEVVLRNFGGNALTSIDVYYDIDGTGGTYNWTGNLAPGSTTTVTLPPISLGAGNHTLLVQTTLPNGVADNNIANDSKTETFITANANDALNLLLRTDNYGSETSWKIEDNANNELISGGPYNDVNGGQTINTPICLPPGCYKFTISDSWGDGMAEGGSPNFILSGAGGTPEYARLSTTTFGQFESHNFCITGTGIITTETVRATIVPNPSAGLFTITYADNQPRVLTITDIQGRTIQQLHYTGGNQQVDLTQQARGVYILQTTTNGQRSSSKLVVE